MPKHIRVFPAALFFIALYLLLQRLIPALVFVVAAWVTNNLPKDVGAGLRDDLIRQWQLMLLALPAIFVLVIISVAFLRAKRDGHRASIGLNVTPPLSFFFLLVILGGALNLVLSWLLAALPIPDAYSRHMEQVAQALSSQGALGRFLVGCILLPITEEIVFRGMAYRILRSAYSVRFCIVTQALLFAFAHFDLLQFVYVFPLSIVLGLVYEWSGCLWASILVHAAFNGLGGLPDFLSKQWSDARYLSIAAVVAFAVTGVVLRLVRRKGIWKKSENQSIS